MSESMDNSRLDIIKDFLAESDTYLQHLNDSLLKAEELIKNNQPIPKDDINLMFRAAHTIKGTASFIDLKTITHLTHEMETILDRIRNDQLTFSAVIIDVLFSAFDSLSALLERLRNEGNDEGDVAESMSKIRAVLSGDAPVLATQSAYPPLGSPANAPMDDELKSYLPAFIEDTEQNIDRFNQILLLMEKGDFQSDYLAELFRMAHTIKGSSGIVKRKDIETVAHRMEDNLAKLRTANQAPSEAVIGVLFNGLDYIKDAVERIHSGDFSVKDYSSVVKKLETLALIKSEEPPASAAIAKMIAVPTIASILGALSHSQKKIVLQAITENKKFYFVSFTIVAETIGKSLKAMALSEKVQKVAIILRAMPKEQEIDDKSSKALRVGYILASDQGMDKIKEALTMDQVNIDKASEVNVSVMQSMVKEVSQAPVESSDVIKAEEPKGNVPAPAAVPVVSPIPVQAVAPATSAVAATKSVPVEMTTMRIDTRKLDYLMNLAGELVIARARFAQLVNDVRVEIDQLRSASMTVENLSRVYVVLKSSMREMAVAGGGGEESQASQKLFEQIDHDFFELRSMVAMKDLSVKMYSLDEATRVLDKLSSDIQNGVMQTRMVQIEVVFSRFKRLVRDIAKEVKKDVKLDIYGEDTELDKKITDELTDPLTHMIRNSMDHGLETPEDRRKAGKSEVGTVVLKASHMGNNICIEITDDGRGLDSERIVKKAIEKGVITQEQSIQMTEREKLNIIFMPGFSTAEKVTGLSGRGVGMDVVKRMIESVNGTIDIETELGKGTTFKMKIPLTLAIIQALLVVVRGQAFAIPLESVSEIIKIKDNDVYSVDGVSTIKLRGHALSLIRLEEVLSISYDFKEERISKKVIVITDGEQLIGVSVDKLIGEDEIVIKALPSHFSNVQGVSGASILGDGRIALILDVSGIIRAAQ